MSGGRRESGVLAMFPIVKLWLYRILVELGGHRSFIEQRGLSSDSLAEAVGLGRWLDDQADRFVASEALADLRARATEIGIPPEVLASRRPLAVLSRSAESTEPPHLPKELLGWRRSAIGEELLEIAREARAARSPPRR